MKQTSSFLDLLAAMAVQTKDACSSCTEKWSQFSCDSVLDWRAEPKSRDFMGFLVGFSSSQRASHSTVFRDFSRLRAALTAAKRAEVSESEIASWALEN